MRVTEEKRLAQLEEAVRRFGEWIDSDTPPDRGHTWLFRHALIMLDGIRELGLIELKKEQLNVQNNARQD